VACTAIRIRAHLAPCLPSRQLPPPSLLAAPLLLLLLLLLLLQT
jgi:hypothetical protein